MKNSVLRAHLKNAVEEYKKKVPNPNTRGVGYYKNKYGNWCKCSTGNLMNSVRLRVGNRRTNTSKVWIDEKQAPYMPYTNEKWISPRWNGKKNPNEKWFDKSVYTFARALVKSFGSGVIRRIR